jgi:dolichol-phosphate mannosyltransferase
VHNEAASIEAFHQRLTLALESSQQDEPFAHEVIYVDDGSTDNSVALVHRLAERDRAVRLVALSRNFGKEIATTAGINAAGGDATVILDSDGQHPPELIGQFLAEWRAGAQIVVGVRRSYADAGPLKRMTSAAYYKAFHAVAGDGLEPASTDFQLIDAEVRQAFGRYTEKSRMTRGILQSMGYRRSSVEFDADPRMGGEASYSTLRLMGLALDSVMQFSRRPLYIPIVIGAALAIVAFITGVAVAVEQLFLGDPLEWDFTGTAMLGILITFLCGLILTCLGIVALYLAAVHEDTLGRPLYLVNSKRSIGQSSWR